MKPTKKKLLQKTIAKLAPERIAPVFAAAISLSMLVAPYAALAQSDSLYLAYPPLAEHAILPANLENDAKVAAYRYLTNEKNVYFNRATGAFLISNLMKRYSRKFAQIDQDPFSMCTLYLTKEQCPDLTDIMLTKTYFSKIDHRVNSLEYLEGIKPKTPDHETDKKEAPAKNNSKTGS